MKKNITFSLLLVGWLLIANQCGVKYPSPETYVCQVSNPTKNLPWLKSIVENALKDGSLIEIYTYSFNNNNTVIKIT